MPRTERNSESYSPAPHDLILPVGSTPELGAATPPVGTSSSQTDRGLFISAPIFVDTWIARPVRQPVTRDFSFKAVVGEPEW